MQTKLNTEVQNFFKLPIESITVEEIKKLYSKGDTNEYGNLLHAAIENKFEEEKVLKFIELILKLGYNVNYKGTFTGYNFIQLALYGYTDQINNNYYSYSTDFIVKLINIAKQYNLDVNTKDADGDSIIHTAIASEIYQGEIVPILNALGPNFDIECKDNNGNDLLKAFDLYQKEAEIISKDGFWCKRLKKEGQIFKNEIEKIRSKNTPKKEIQKTQENKPKEEIQKPQENIPKEKIQKPQENIPKEEIQKPQENTPKEEIQKPQENKPKEKIQKPQENIPKEEIQKPQENILKKEIQKPQENTPKEEIQKPQENTPKEEIQKPQENTPKEKIQVKPQMQIEELIYKIKNEYTLSNRDEILREIAKFKGHEFSDLQGKEVVSYCYLVNTMNEIRRIIKSEMFNKINLNYSEYNLHELYEIRSTLETISDYIDKMSEHIYYICRGYSNKYQDAVNKMKNIAEERIDISNSLYYSTFYHPSEFINCIRKILDLKDSKYFKEEELKDIVDSAVSYELKKYELRNRW